MVNAPEASLQEPLARLVPVLLREVHQYRHEEAVSEDKLALGIVAAGCNLHRL